jgi:hypothetical protein
MEKRQLQTIQRLLGHVAGSPDPKITALIADLERDVLAVPGEKAIVFTEYRDTLISLREAFQAHAGLQDAFAELTGGLTPRQRRQRIVRFHNATCRVLLATDAASEGLNLQGQCCRVYHIELPWNPNRLEQRNGRIDRHGQTRRPIIRYLFYPDSPEDRVLDRLVQRISAMHDDRVSTPDILGILEGCRLEEVLGSIESIEDGARKSDNLVRLFDAQRQEFSSQFAPILLGELSQQFSMPYADSVSADPLIEDDENFDAAMRSMLEPHLCPGSIPDTWRIDVPRRLQGKGVLTKYECATFRRSVAVQYPADQVEFIHRLHPLTQAIAEHAWHELTVEAARNEFAARVAVRRHNLAKQPLAIFTFLERDSHPKGTVFSIAITGAGDLVDKEIARKLVEECNGELVGEVPWNQCERVFEKDFAILQTRAREAACQHVGELIKRERGRRMEVTRMLREEAALYKEDRLAEIDEQEQTERAGVREQTELYRESATNWQARRAAVETYYRRRLEEIDRFGTIPEPAEPQALGILLVFPQD